MQHIIKFIFSPLAFALGFLWPLLTQVGVSLGLLPMGVTGIVVGGSIAIALGLMAQLRGSWIWIK